MERLPQLRVGFVGAGRMARAIAQAVLLAGKAGAPMLQDLGALSRQDNPEGPFSYWPKRLVASQEAHLRRRFSSLCPDPAGQPRRFEGQGRAKMGRANREKPGNLAAGSPPLAQALQPNVEPWRTDEKVQAWNILASAPSDKNLDRFQSFGCRITHSNLEVLETCSLVFLATKPHNLRDVLQEVAPAVSPDHILVSMAAGVSLQTLEELLPAGAKVLRIMPNLPCVVQSGAILLARGTSAGEEEVSLVKALLSPCGLCEEAPESNIDIHTGLSGSGVAYVYMFAEAMAEGAVKMGMSGTLANKMAAQTLLGAAKMMLKSGEHPAVLRNEVCTPGGTTIHALHELEKGALRATVMNAVERATSWAQELGKR